MACYGYIVFKNTTYVLLSWQQALSLCKVFEEFLRDHPGIRSAIEADTWERPRAALVYEILSALLQEREVIELPQVGPCGIDRLGVLHQEQIQPVARETCRIRI